MRLAWLLLLVPLSAVAQTECHVAEGKATIVFFRDNSSGGKATDGEAWIDGSRACRERKFRPGTYCKVEVATGTRTIRGNDSKNEVSLCAAPGRDYYFRVRYSYPPRFWIIGVHNYYEPELVSEEVGKLALTRLKPY
jgi:hypothetical protein